MDPKSKIKISLLLVGFAGLLFYALNVYAGNRIAEIKGSVDPDIAMRKYMLEISAQIGESCAFCHSVKNFKDNSMETFKIAKNHMRIVDWLNNEGFYKDRKGTKVSCYVCHKGKAKPDFEQKLGIGH